MNEVSNWQLLLGLYQNDTNGLHHQLSGDAETHVVLPFDLLLFEQFPDQFPTQYADGMFHPNNSNFNK